METSKHVRRSFSREAKKELTCPICFELFKSPNDPKDLPECQHIYCEICLPGLIMNKTTIKCPECRKTSRIPEGGVTQLKTNLKLRNLAEELDAYTSLKLNSKTHERQEFAECAEHQSEYLRFFCKYCDKTFCQLCLVPNHRYHDFCNLTEILDRQKQQVLEQIEEASQELDLCQNTLEELNRQHEEYQYSVETEHKKIERCVRKHVANIHNEEQSLKKQLQKYESEATFPTEVKEEMQIFEKKLDTLNAIQSSVQQKDDFTFPDLYKSIMEQLENLCKDETSILLDFDKASIPHFIPTPVQCAVPTLGAIVSKEESRDDSHKTRPTQELNPSYNETNRATNDQVCSGEDDETIPNVAASATGGSKRRYENVPSTPQIAIADDEHVIDPEVSQVCASATTSDLSEKPNPSSHETDRVTDDQVCSGEHGENDKTVTKVAASATHRSKRRYENVPSTHQIPIANDEHEIDPVVSQACASATTSDLSEKPNPSSHETHQVMNDQVFPDDSDGKTVTKVATSATHESKRRYENVPLTLITAIANDEQKVYPEISQACATTSDLSENPNLSSHETDQVTNDQVCSGENDKTVTNVAASATHGSKRWYENVPSTPQTAIANDEHGVDPEVSQARATSSDFSKNPAGAESFQSGLENTDASTLKLELVTEFGSFTDATSIASLGSIIAVCDRQKCQTSVYRNTIGHYYMLMHTIKSSQPRGVAIMDNGKIVIANRTNAEIYSRDSLTKIILQTSKNRGDDFDIESALVVKGNVVLLGDICRHVITEHDESGEIIDTTSTEGVKPYYMAVLKDKRIAVSDYEQGVFLIVDFSDADAEHMRLQIINAYGLCFTPYISGGLFLIASRKRGGLSIRGQGSIDYYKFDQNGELSFGRLVEGLHRPSGLTLVSKDKLAVAYKKSVKIYRFAC